MRESLRRYIDGGIQSLEGFANLAGSQRRNLSNRAGSAAGSASGS
ncbi:MULTISPECIES: hypothetical protein [unclassified Arthrobacter]|nr:MULTISPECIES: hypothetical protein [unclassified Arthrobacter]